MTPWLDRLEHDPIRGLLSPDNAAVSYFVRRDLLGEEVGSINRIWGLPGVGKLLKGQSPDGSWRYPGKRTVVYPPHHHELMETFKRVRLLVERYRMTPTLGMSWTGSSSIRSRTGSGNSPTWRGNGPRTTRRTG